jgi:YHS domain-containing protein
MKKLSINFLLVCISLISVASCKTMKSESAAPATAICPVCKMKVNTAEGYSDTYNGKTYYFDNVDCKKSFKMNPTNFITK